MTAEHTHSGGCGHDHAHAHSHAPTPQALAGDRRARRALIAALVIGVVVMIAQTIAGFSFQSLALLGDAAHMATDVGAYAIALFAAHVALRPPSPTRTFGYGRVEILAALVNGATLLLISGWILIEAIRRMLSPLDVSAPGMTAVAAVGLLANGVVLLLLWRSGSSSLNMRAAMLHALGDMLGSLAAVSAGVVIWATGFTRADSVASLILTMLIVVAAWRLVRRSADILLDAAPTGIDAGRIAAELMAHEAVVETRNVHVWTLAPGILAASAHVRVKAGSPVDACVDDLTRSLRTRFGIDHATVQVRTDLGSTFGSAPIMSGHDAAEWSADHVGWASPELSHAVIVAAAGAAALGGSGAELGHVSPADLRSRRLEPPT